MLPTPCHAERLVRAQYNRAGGARTRARNWQAARPLRKCRSVPQEPKPVRIPGARHPINRHSAALLLAACQLIVCGGAIAAAAAPQGRIVGYATGWSGAEDGDAGKIDTLIFAFAAVV